MYIISEVNQVFRLPGISVSKEAERRPVPVRIFLSDVLQLHMQYIVDIQSKSSVSIPTDYNVDRTSSTSPSGSLSSREVLTAFSQTPGRERPPIAPLHVSILPIEFFLSSDNMTFREHRSCPSPSWLLVLDVLSWKFLTE